jgi:hypothetical protein
MVTVAGSSDFTVQYSQGWDKTDPALTWGATYFIHECAHIILKAFKYTICISCILLY